jgi:hypothetical protein
MAEEAWLVLAVMSANLGASFAMSQLQFWGMEMDKPTISVDESGWPVSAAWAGMKKPLFTSRIGSFASVKVDSFVPRSGEQTVCQQLCGA